MRQLVKKLLSPVKAIKTSRNPQNVFRRIYIENLWGDDESRSGWGSRLDCTQKIRRDLPEIIRMLEARSILDIPCGDFNWMRHTDLGECQYIGADVVPELIDELQAKYGSTRRSFLRLDLVADTLPAVDLVFCRDCLIHLSNRQVQRALDRIRSSGSEYLLTTTFPTADRNDDIRTGDYRPVNLQAAPFLLPEPLLLLDEKTAGRNSRNLGRYMGLWKIADL